MTANGADNTQNQRVTNALLRRDIQALTKRLEEWRDEDRTLHSDHEDRLRALERWSAESHTRWTTNDAGTITGFAVAIVAAVKAFFFDQ